LKCTDVLAPDYFHKVVDCQWACPAHTPVPEYIRLVAAERYDDAYLLNWHSNVFPGILGRVCDRPCEPACRRGRIEKDAVAICRLKRVAADFKGDIRKQLPPIAEQRNGKHIACVGAGPASLTVARDLAAIGYSVTVLDSGQSPGGMMRSQIPKFRLPDAVIDEECAYILERGVEAEFNHPVHSLRDLLADGWDAVFVGTGAPRGRDADLPGRREAAAHIHIGIDWLAGVAFGHVKTVSRRVLVLGGGNTAMDCCRSARRLGGDDVKVVVRSGFAEMKASPWEKEEAVHEGIPILNDLVPKAFDHIDGKLTGVRFEKVRAEFDAAGRRTLVSAGEPEVSFECDEVLVAIGQENTFAWIERDLGVEFDKYGMPVLNLKTLQSSLPRVFFGGDSAFGPKNIITAVAHGHEAAISIDRFCQGVEPGKRPGLHYRMTSQKMGIHEWSYHNQVSVDQRIKVPTQALSRTLNSIGLELELGFDPVMALEEANRCLNCDIETVFTPRICIECDACVDICPTECITFTAPGEEGDDAAAEHDLRNRLRAPADNRDQALYIADGLKTGRVMVKDENVCLHCGLCAERCPTGAWDMQQFYLEMPQAGPEIRQS
jgi:NADPH-dependent glutamate synthase beta subunit-like oxidoreductase